MLSPTIRNKTRILSTLQFNIIVDIPDTAIKQQKEINGIHIKTEEVKWCLFADDLILHIENPKEFTKNLSELINEFRTVAGYKLNIKIYIISTN